MILFVLISKGATWIVKNEFIKDDRTGFSGWNQFYIGINEPEFGFMDGDFSEDRSFEDVKKALQAGVYMTRTNQKQSIGPIETVLYY